MIDYCTHTCVNKNMMPGKSNVCKAFQEAILCIKGTLSIVLSSAHSLPISTPCQTSPPSLHSNTHTHAQYTKGTWANLVPIKQADPRLIPVTGGWEVSAEVVFQVRWGQGKKSRRLVLANSIQGQNQKSWIVQNPQGKFQATNKRQQKLTDGGRKGEIWPRQ